MRETNRPDVEDQYGKAMNGTGWKEGKILEEVELIYMARPKLKA